MKIPFVDWVTLQYVPGNMIWKGAAEGQAEDFGEVVCAAEGVELSVVGMHTSKSIALPIVEASIPTLGLRVVMRHNFDNLAVTIESARPLGPLAFPEEWQATTKDAYSCYFEGFDEAGIPVYKPTPAIEAAPRSCFSFHAWGRCTPKVVVSYIAQLTLAAKQET